MPDSAPPLSEEARRAIVQDCQALTILFYHLLDRRQDEAVAALMTPTGVWARIEGEVCGGPAVLAALAARPQGRITRHLISNVVVDAKGADAASACYEVSAYGQFGEGPAALAAILTGQDNLERLDGIWRIARKQSRLLFKFG